MNNNDQTINSGELTQGELDLKLNSGEIDKDNKSLHALEESRKRLKQTILESEQKEQGSLIDRVYAVEVRIPEGKEDDEDYVESQIDEGNFLFHSRIY